MIDCIVLLYSARPTVIELYEKRISNKYVE